MTTEKAVARENEDLFKNKGGLSGEERLEFNKILKKSESICRPGDLNCNLEYNFIKEKILSNRKYIALSCLFTDEELELLDIFDYFSEDAETRADYFNFSYVIFDHKFIVEEKIMLAEALDAKIMFTLGISDVKNYYHNSSFNTLFDIFAFLKDYNYYAYYTVYNAVSNYHLKDINSMLSDLASVLSVSHSNADINYSSSALHIECIFPDTKSPNKFSYYVNDVDAERSAFKRVYDFYFSGRGRKVFENLISAVNSYEKRKSDAVKDKLSLSRLRVDRAKTEKISQMLSGYSTDISMKISGLRKKEL
jgi:hypothetical protein